MCALLERASGSAVPCKVLGLASVKGGSACHVLHNHPQKPLTCAYSCNALRGKSCHCECWWAGVVCCWERHAWRSRRWP